MSFVPASAATVRRAAFIAARSVLSRRRDNIPTSGDCLFEPLEPRTLFNAYVVPLQGNPPQTQDDSGSLHIKPEYDADGDGVTDSAVQASTGVDAIRQVVEGSWCHTVHNCATSTTYAYGFPDRADTAPDAPYWIDVSDDPNTHAAQGVIGLETDFDNPDVPPSARNWTDAVWSVSAIVPTLDSLTVTSQQWSDETATATDSATRTVNLSLQDDGSDPSQLSAIVGLSGTFSPDNEWTREHALYEITDGAGSSFASGTLDGAPPVTLDFNGQHYTDGYTVKGGIDLNSNGTLDADEVARTVKADDEKLTIEIVNPPQQYDANTKTLTLSKANRNAVSLQVRASSGKNRIPNPHLNFSTPEKASMQQRKRPGQDYILEFSPVQTAANGTESFNVRDATDPAHERVAFTITIKLTD